MSQDSSTKDSSSSDNSQNLIVMMQKDKDDLTLYGAPAPVRLSRSGTVRRATTLASSKAQAESISISIEEPENVSTKVESVIETHPNERYRKSLDSTYRHSLESISEYKPKHSFSSASLYPSRDTGSVESSSSDCTDYAMRSSLTDTTFDKTFLSASSSYLSWIESVNSEYFGTANSAVDIMDVDTKVGEWNNFWLNYNSTNNRYLSSPYLSVSNDEKTAEDLSDCKSTCSTQRDITDKQFSVDHIFLSHDEILETLRCSQRITEILQNALKRGENEFEESKTESFYSQTFPFLFSTFRRKPPTPKERVRSYSLEPQELLRQKQMLKPPTQSGNSCINVLLNNSVADILKRVINKRREAMSSDDTPTASRGSFSDWSSAK